MLNYVDFRKVLKGFAEYLKPGGRIIVFNLPNRGNGLLFSDKGLKDNRQLYAFLEEHHFEIEHKGFPKRPRNETDQSEELIVLVARKVCSSRNGAAESDQDHTPEPTTSREIGFGKYPFQNQIAAKQNERGAGR
jgi:hypothetical protein